MTNVLTEKMLDTEYSDNGVVVQDFGQARYMLRKKNYKEISDNVYKDVHGRVARLYTLRNSILDSSYPHKPVSYYPAGVLVSFGGNAKSGRELKFTKVVCAEK